MDWGKIKIERLSGDVSSSELNKFHSDDNNLNIFLRRKARKHQNRLLAVTYLLYYDNEIIGYYSLSSDTMQATDIIKSKYEKGKQYSAYPAVKICRLAISKDFAKVGIGSFLLDSIKMDFANNEQKVGSKYLLVDAYNNVLHFYEKNGFEYWTKEDKDDDTRLMYYDLMKSKINAN